MRHRYAGPLYKYAKKAIFNLTSLFNIFTLDLIDKVLAEDDVNNDGYLEYVEYVMGRKRDHDAQEKRNKLRMGT